MNERIKKLRKALDLTQQEFADRIGVKRNTIATYEIGRNTPLDAVISSICREFGVSEDWLRTGAGEMFAPKDEDTLSALFAEVGATELEQQIVRAFLCIDEHIRVPLMQKLMHEVQSSVPAAEPEPDPMDDIERQVEDYRRRLLLEKKQTGTPSPSSADDVTA